LTPSRVALGLVGAGRLAEVGYLPAARLARRARIVAIADPDPDRRARLGAGEVPAHPTTEELLAAGGLDGIVIASPPGAHEDGARLAAAAGLPALVEKPPAPDLAGARRLAALEPAPRIGFNRRFSLGRELAGSLAGSGSIELEITYRRFSWSPVMVRDPAVLDLAPHLVDLAFRAGIGRVRGVTATSERPERVSIAIEGTAARARITCATDRAYRERVVVRDAGGRVTFRRREGGLVGGAVSRVRRGPHPLVGSLAAQLDAFAASCAGESAPDLATAADGVAVMAVIANAAESLAHGGQQVRPREHEVTA